MQALERLTAEARALATGPGLPNVAAGADVADVAEVARVMQICNACRYCEGFCAVFPAMTRRLQFDAADAHYLANLCHHCGACLHACQYAPPHEFAVNVPRAMARVRRQTYVAHAWPPALGALYQRNGLVLALALAIGLALFLALALWRHGTLWQAPANGFYGVFPHGLLVALFAPVFGFVVLAFAMGLRRFLRGVTPASSGAPASWPAAAEATHDVLTLHYLDGGHGEGCHNDSDAWTHARRRCHHLVFYGFLLCFAATASGTLFHYLLGWPAPYALPALPKLLGAAGGLMLMAGCAGLWRLQRSRHPLHGDPAQRPMDLGFIALLFLTAATGFAVWGARGTAALPLALCAHLGSVMALFCTMPYGKFAHGVYRGAALLRHAVEKRQPNPVGLGAD
ncbi:tricarballylate utilization 4Fe-4S protein TcuB [Aquabacterium sp.]|uniref:tricarballylate utilization 4Fe-4S protein TcuB n=1 Tax=Aquabacterium sp. TaxID=1872578 RepID=UPI0037846845